MVRKLSLLLSLCLILGSCASQRKTIYLQDAEPDAQTEISSTGQIRFKPLDRLTVVVSSKNPELAAPFNSYATSTLPTAGTIGMGSESTPTQTTSGIQILTISDEGLLDIPVVGKIQASGLTRSELSEAIATTIREGGYIDDPTVNIQFSNMTISVLGEVTQPGQYPITSDKISLFEALALAGDMTIQGKREDVMVIREVDGIRTTTLLDLRSAEIFNSPYFYLQQNDVVYVKPNKHRSRAGQLDPNQGFYFSLIGSLLSIATLVATLTL